MLGRLFVFVGARRKRKTRRALTRAPIRRITRRTSTRGPARKKYIAYKAAARAIVLERLDFYSQALGVKFHRVSIKNQKTRWGSCSRRGNLNFNYKIVFLPERHRDYIIVHELCHLKEFNHSPRFWALVEQVFPDYRKIKRELRDHEVLYR